MRNLIRYLPLCAFLWCNTVCFAADPSTARTTTAPDAQTDVTQPSDLIPPTSYWPRFMLGASLGLFMVAAIIGPLVLAQSRRE